MHILSIILLGIAANLDNLGIGCHGCRVVLPSGKELSVDNLRMVVREPIKADMDYSGHISMKEAILLGAGPGS